MLCIYAAPVLKAGAYVCIIIIHPCFQRRPLCLTYPPWQDTSACCCFSLQTLFESGMLDATETSALSHPVEAAERRLELLGPVWRAPSVLEVLRQLPFMRGQPQSMLEFFLRSVVSPGQRGTAWAEPRRSAWQSSQSNSLGGARTGQRNCAPKGIL
jgi:hypothetical protein